MPCRTPPPARSETPNEPHPMKLTWKERFRGLDIAVDLGTARTRVFVRGHGLVSDEASAVLFKGGGNPRFPTRRGKVLAVGDDAPRAATSGAGELVRPVEDGCLHDPEAAEALLKGLLRKAGVTGFRRKDRMVLVHAGCGGAPEMTAAKNVAIRVGAREVFIIEASMSAMIGTGEDVTDEETRMVFDVGAGVAEAALIRRAGIVHRESLRLGTERIRPENAPDETSAVLELLLSLAARCAAAVPPDQAGSLRTNGLWLVGGGALLPGFADAVAKRTGLPVHTPDDPTLAVIRGTGRVLDELKYLSRLPAR